MPKPRTINDMIMDFQMSDMLLNGIQWFYSFGTDSDGDYQGFRTGCQGFLDIEVKWRKRPFDDSYSVELECLDGGQEIYPLESYEPAYVLPRAIETVKQRIKEINGYFESL